MPEGECLRRRILVDEAAGGLLLALRSPTVLAASGSAAPAADGGRPSPEQLERARRRRRAGDGRTIRLATINVSGAGTLRRLAPDLVEEADMVAVQEHKLAEPKDIALVRAALAEVGWRSAFEPALRTAAGGTSGGVALLFKRHLRCVEIAPSVCPGRSLVARFRLHGFGDFLVGSVYAQDGLGLAGMNETLYGDLMEHLEDQGAPYVVLGDHNMAPAVLARFLAERCVAGSVLAPEAPTYVAGASLSVLDYMLAHRLLRGHLSPPEVCEGLGLRPHRMVRTVFRPPGPEEVVKVWQRPDFGSANRLYGPQVPEAAGAQALVADFLSFASAHGGFEATRDATPAMQAELGGLFTRWADLVWEELGPNCGMPRAPCAPLRFVDRPIGELLAPPRSGRAGAAQRALHRVHEWSLEVRGLVGRRARGDAAPSLVRRARALAAAIHRRQSRVLQDGSAIADESLLQASLAALLWLLGAVVREAVPAACTLAGAVVVALEAADQEARCRAAAGRRDRWAVWAEAAFEGHAAAAFRFVARPRAADAAATCLSVQEELKRDIDVWSGIWGVGSPAAAWDCLAGQPLPPRLTPDDLVRASRGFPARTAAVDGLHPRQLQWLSAGMLEATCLLLRAFEVCGELGGDAREDLVVRLIPKPSGGCRPIMLFRTLFRVWGRARAVVLRSWAASALSHPRWNNFNWRRPGDGVWRGLLQAEACEEQDAVVLGALLDISKMFDHVDRAILLRRAEDVGYPMWLLRLCCRAYGWRRSLVSPDGLAGPPLLPCRGVAAGSFAAVFEVAALLAGAMEHHARRWPEVALSIHVDDFALEGVFFDRERAAVVFAAAAQDLRGVLEDDLRLPLGKEKTALVASDPAVGQRVARLLTDLGGCVEAAPRRLGLRWSLRVSRDRALQRSRLAKFREKVGRLRILAKAVKAGRRCGPGRCYAALLAGPLYGVEVQPLPDAALRRLRRDGARLLRLSVPGGALGFAWALEAPGRDPAARHWWAVLLRYCREWFYAGAGPEELRPADVLRPPVLVRTFEAACRRWEQAVAAGRSPRLARPLDGVLRAALEAGWVFDGATRLLDRRGRVMDLLNASPAYLQAQYFRDFQQEQVWRTLRERFEAPEALRFPDVASLRRALGGRGATCLSVAERRALLAFASGVVPTAQRLHRWGCCASPLCLLCGRTDSVEHRLFGPCAPTPALVDGGGGGGGGVGGDEACAEAEPQALADDYAVGGGLGDTARCEDLLLAWFPELVRPSGPWVADGFALQAGGSASGVVEKGDVVSAVFDAGSGPVYIDGSCLAPCTPYASAAGAAVQLGPDGTPCAWVTFAVPGDWPQTAAAAEHLALRFADELTVPGQLVVTDCAAVLASARGGPRFARGERRPWAAVWREVPGGRPVAKVKAHLTRHVAAERGEEAWWAGNAAADDLAKRRARAGLPPDGLAAEVDARMRARLGFLRGAARALVRYPVARDLMQPRTGGREPEAGRLVVYHGHEALWCAIRRLWTCSLCWRRAPAGELQRFSKETCCRSGGVHAVALSARARGHDPYIGHAVGGSTAVLACVRCGAYAEHHARGLDAPCPGRLRGGGTSSRLRRFLGGRHPRADIQLAEPVRCLV